MPEHEHIVSSYQEQLVSLDNKIAKMGGLAEELLGHSMESVERRDPKLAEKTIRDDDVIDRLEHEVEEQAIQMIARRQPVALDLRQIMTAIRISSDLERIGDLAKNIAKRSLAVSGEKHPKALVVGLKHTAEMAMMQLKDVLDAYIERDADKAHKVWYRDEEIDAMYNSLFREFLTYMMEDPRNIGMCTHFLFCAKNLERIGDHATNIAEMVHYLVHGEPLVDERPKSDETSTTKIKVEGKTKAKAH